MNCCCNCHFCLIKKNKSMYANRFTKTASFIFLYCLRCWRLYTFDALIVICYYYFQFIFRSLWEISLMIHRRFNFWRIVKRRIANGCWYNKASLPIVNSYFMSFRGKYLRNKCLSPTKSRCMIIKLISLKVFSGLIAKIYSNKWMKAN